MPTGRIKYCKPEKGFGFIAQDSGEADVFLHVSAIKGAYDEIHVGQRVEYKVVEGNRGSVAQNVEFILTPLEQKRLSQGKVVIPRDYAPAQNRSGSSEVKPLPPSQTASQSVPTPTPASQQPEHKTDSANVKPTAPEPVKGPPSQEAPLERAAKPEAVSKPEAEPKAKTVSKPPEQPSFGDLYIRKQVRFQTPMFFGLYNHMQLPATVREFTKYNFVLQGEDEPQELPKTDVKYCYKAEDSEKVQLLIHHNDELIEQKLTPIIQRKKRYNIDTPAIQQARIDRYPIEVTTREGEMFRGLVDWVSRYEIKMILENGSKVIVFRHAICYFEAFPSEVREENQPQPGNDNRIADEKADQE